MARTPWAVNSGRLMGDKVPKVPKVPPKVLFSAGSLLEITMQEPVVRSKKSLATSFGTTSRNGAVQRRIRSPSEVPWFTPVCSLSDLRWPSKIRGRF